MQADRTQRFAIWSQAVFEGEVDQDSVEALIAADRAEAFEGKLLPSVKAELSKHLYDTDQQIMQVGSQYFDEYERVGALLRERGEKVVIRTHPREKDARWPEVLDMQKRRARKEGILHGYYDPSFAASGVRGKQGKRLLTYVFVAWKEWPILRRYREKHDLILYQRVLMTRRWIATEYARRGMKLFED